MTRAGCNGFRAGRRVAWWLAAATVGGGVGAAAALELPRGMLRRVVDTCAFAKRNVGTALPCLAVDLGGEGRPATATLRAPDSSTHLIVTPLAPIDGIEDPRLLRPEAGTYWRVALDARTLVSEAAGARVSPGLVGLAINSAATRSQDHLHIHAECVRPAVLTALRHRPPPPDGAWHRAEEAVAGERPFLRRVGRAEIKGGNLFALLATLPGGHAIPAGPAGVKALLVDGPGSGDFVLAATRSSRNSVEAYYDASCRIARRD